MTVDDLFFEPHGLKKGSNFSSANITIGVHGKDHLLPSLLPGGEFLLEISEPGLVWVCGACGCTWNMLTRLAIEVKAVLGVDCVFGLCLRSRRWFAREISCHNAGSVGAFAFNEHTGPSAQS